MSFSLENILMFGGILLLISVVSSKTSYRIGVPTLMLFIGVGMLAGSEGIGGIWFDDPTIAQFLGVIALNIILFSGGMDTNWANIKPIWVKGVTLSTLGVLLTALCVGVFCYYAMGTFPLIESLLLGATISSTDVASTFAIFRQKEAGLKHNLRPLLEFESGSNDPMAFFLTVSLISLIQNPESSWLMLIPKFFGGMIIGALGGFVFGKLSVWFINRIRLDIDGLYPVMAMALVFIAYTVTDAVSGNGFLAVYIMGVILGNKTIVHKSSLMKFFDGISWLMQIVMFLTLGLLVFPSKMWEIAIPGIIISLFLIFIARPVAVLLCTLPWKMQTRDRVFLSWCGLRGAVPIIFATYPLVAGVPQASTIFNIVFFISLTSLLFQGSTVFHCARLLGLVVPSKLKPHYFVHLADTYRSELREVVVTENSHVAGRQILEIKIPDSILVVLIDRRGRFFSPRGSTRLELGDKLYIIAENPKQVEEFAQYVSMPLETAAK